VKWNLRLAAAKRDIWKASDMRQLRAEHGLPISVGKMPNLWSGQPTSIRLDDLEVVCAVLGCGPDELLLPEPSKVQRQTETAEVERPAAGCRCGATTPARRA
jgi:DNA-binding Xre family transcriptional regulator